MTQEEPTERSADDIVIHVERPFWRRVLFVLVELGPAIRNTWRDSRFL